MIKKIDWNSLRTKLVLNELLALLVGVIIGLGIMLCCRVLIERFYLNEDSVIRREKRLAEKLEKYVEQNQVRSKDYQKLNAWCADKGNVYLTVYHKKGTEQEKRPEKESYVSGQTSSEEYDKEAFADSKEYRVLMESRAYEIEFSDGNFLVSITEQSQNSLYAASAVLALLVFCFIVLFASVRYANRITGKVIRLSEQVQKIGNGMTQSRMDITGEDELAELSKEIDKMRSALMDRLYMEQKAYENNNQLLTSISHDVRTPLTALIGYLELLQNDLSGEMAKTYVERSRDKAYQLKNLTDELFSYFVVYSKKTVNYEPEEVNAPLFFGQIFDEACIRLEGAGFSVVYEPLSENCRIKTDLQLFRRLMDNFLNNMEKHADHQKPIEICIKKEHQSVLIRLENAIPQVPNPVQSTKIGLKTCEKLAEVLQVRYRIIAESDYVVIIEVSCEK